MADNDVTRIAGNIGAMNALNALTVINKQPFRTTNPVGDR